VSPSAEAAPAVSIRGLHKTFLSRRGSAVEAIRDVTIDVAEGEVVAVIGPSGCGKSSLLRVLAGLDKVYGGEVDLVVNEQKSRGDDARLRAATVFQSDSTLPWLTVRRNITAVGLANLRLSKAEKTARAEEVLHLVGWRTSPRRTRTSSRAACASACRSPGRWRRDRTCC